MMSLSGEIGEMGLDTIRESFNGLEQSLEWVWIVRHLA